MNEADTINTLASRLDNMHMDDMKSMINALEALLSKVKDKLAAPAPSPTPAADYTYSTEVLSKTLLADVNTHVRKLKYTSQGRNSPSIFLYGDTRYGYNKASNELDPVAIESEPVMAELIMFVNQKHGTAYNSLLINKYATVNTKLGWHQDDESCLDTSSPIGTLSIGATRRFQISAASEVNRVIDTVNVSDNSLLVMLPGFQSKYYHQVPAGRKVRVRMECATVLHSVR